MSLDPISKFVFLNTFTWVTQLINNWSMSEHLIDFVKNALISWILQYVYEQCWAPSQYIDGGLHRHGDFHHKGKTLVVILLCLEIDYYPQKYRQNVRNLGDRFRDKVKDQNSNFYKKPNKNWLFIWYEIKSFLTVFKDSYHSVQFELKYKNWKSYR